MDEITAKNLLLESGEKDPYGKILEKLLSGSKTIAAAKYQIECDKFFKRQQTLQYWKDYHQEHRDYRLSNYRKKHPFINEKCERQGSNRFSWNVKTKTKLKYKKISSLNGKEIYD